MTDVLKIALDRRAELHEEVAKLDEFIRMAEVLIRTSQQLPVPDVGATDEMPKRPARVAGPADAPQMRRPEHEDANVTVGRPQVIRRGPAANSA